MTSKTKTTYRLTGRALDVYTTWASTEKAFGIQFVKAEAGGADLTALDNAFEQAHSKFWADLSKVLELDMTEGMWTLDEDFAALGIVYLVYAKSADELEGLDDDAILINQGDDDEEGLDPLHGSLDMLDDLDLCA